MIFYENVWKSGELSTGWGHEVRPREVYVKDNSDNFTPEGEDNSDNLKIIDLIDVWIDENCRKNRISQHVCSFRF